MRAGALNACVSVVAGTSASLEVCVEPLPVGAVLVSVDEDVFFANEALSSGDVISEHPTVRSAMLSADRVFLNIVSIAVFRVSVLVLSPSFKAGSTPSAYQHVNRCCQRGCVVECECAIWIVLNQGAVWDQLERLRWSHWGRLPAIGPPELL